MCNMGTCTEHADQELDFHGEVVVAAVLERGKMSERERRRNIEGETRDQTPAREIRAVSLTRRFVAPVSIRSLPS